MIALMLAAVQPTAAAATKLVAELVVPAPMKCLRPDPEGGTPLAPPKVVSTYPAQGAVVRPGLLMLRVTFDQAMACAGAFAEDQAWAFPCPSLQNMVLSYDRRTVRTVCLVGPNTHYSLWLDRKPGSGDFVNLAGRAASAQQLLFSTSTAPPITSACDAISEDAETAAEVAKQGRLDCR